MAKCKLGFWDIIVELEDVNVSAITISDRALSLLGFLIPERLKLAESEPGEAEDTPGHDPNQQTAHIAEIPSTLMAGYE